jgi:hypothetical protein
MTPQFIFLYSTCITHSLEGQTFSNPVVALRVLEITLKTSIIDEILPVRQGY